MKNKENEKNLGSNQKYLWSFYRIAYGAVNGVCGFILLGIISGHPHPSLAIIVFFVLGITWAHVDTDIEYKIEELNGVYKDRSVR